MFSRRFYLISAILLTVGCALIGKTDHRRPIVVTILSTSVKVALPSGAHGSGTIIRSSFSESYVLTNRHVCDAGKLPMGENSTSYEPFLIKHTTGTYRGNVVAVADYTDLCLVHVEKGQLPVAQIGERPASLGDSIITTGNPGPVNNFISEGFAGEMVIVWGMLFQATALPTYPGQSGSGVFTPDSKLVGVATYGILGAPHLSGMVPLNYVRAFLKEMGMLK